MSTSVKAVLRPAQKDGLLPVSVRITAFRRHSYVSTGVAVSAKFWNPEGKLERLNWIRAPHPDAAILNNAIRDRLALAQKVALDFPQLSAAELREKIKPRPVEAAPAALDVLALVRKDAARRALGGHPRMAAKYMTLWQKMQSFLLGIPHPRRSALLQESDELRAARQALTLPLDQFTANWVRDYEEYLLALPNKQTSVQREIALLHTLLARAVERGDVPEAANPLRRLRVATGKHRPKSKLTDEEVARLVALTPQELTAPRRPTLSGRPRNSRLWARDAWLLQFYLLGSRIGDALALRWRDVQPDGITFTEQKTGKVKLAPRHPELDALLARLAPAGPPDPAAFVLPYFNRARWRVPAHLDWAALSCLPEHRGTWLLWLKTVASATSTINSNLLEVMELAGIRKHLTTHTARHSFADRGRRLKVSASDMRDLLNHHSVAQTEAYYGELEASEVSQIAQAIYGRS